MRNDDVYLQLYLIRHAESMGNIETDEEFDKINPPLTAHGKKQAEALGKRFEEQKPDVVYASPLLRARQTAEPLNTEILLLNEISEKDVSVDTEGFSVIEEI